MKARLFVLLIIVAGTLQAQNKLPEVATIQAPIVNLRTQPSLKGAIVIKLKQMDYVTILETGITETIDGVKDYWYKVEATDDKAAKHTGYVFGHLLSVKQAGRTSKIMTFNGCEMGDYFHLFFDNTDFGDGDNHYGEYDLCLDTDSTSYPNPKYKGQQFELTLNTIMVRAYCGGGSMEICNRPVESIISMRLVSNKK